jgi:MATE family multidrug resistance protein
MTTDRATRNRMIFALALPIVGGMISQNVLNLVDTGMVGRLGDDALAGVGVGGFANFTGVATVMGLSAGVQAISARRFGAGDTENTAEPLNAALVISVLVALPLSILLVWAAPYLFPYLNSDPEVIAHGVPYLQVRMLAMTAVGFNFAFRGYWNAINLPKLYLRTLVTMHLLNIVLNWMFIFGNGGAPELGAMGAGLASAIATVGGAIYYVALGLKYAKPHGFLKERPSRKSIRAVLKLAIPASLMQVTFAAGLTTLFWIIGQVGTVETAAATVLINIMLVAILPGLAFGLAAASLVGQALGRNDKADAMQWPGCAAVATLRWNHDCGCGDVGAYERTARRRGFLHRHADFHRFSMGAVFTLCLFRRARHGGRPARYLVRPDRIPYDSIRGLCGDLEKRQMAKHRGLSRATGQAC